MAPPRKSKASLEQPDPISQEAQSQTSQDIDMSLMQGAMEQHRKNVKTRRRARENAIRQAHQERMEALRLKLEAAVERNEQHFRARQRPQVLRLSELIQKKRQLEQAIITAKGKMDKLIETAVSHLQVGIEKQKADIEGENSP